MDATGAFEIYVLAWKRVSHASEVSERLRPSTAERRLTLGPRPKRPNPVRTTRPQSARTEAVTVAAEMRVRRQRVPTVESTAGVGLPTGGSRRSGRDALDHTIWEAHRLDLAEPQTGSCKKPAVFGVGAFLAARNHEHVDIAEQCGNWIAAVFWDEALDDQHSAVCGHRL